MKFCGLVSGKASAEKVEYGKFTDKITTVYNYTKFLGNGLAHAC